MNDQFKYQQILLYYFDKDTNIRFQKSRAHLDLQASRFVIIIGILLSILFLVLDIYRFQLINISLIFRGGLAVCLFTFYIISLSLKKENFRLIQIYILAMVFFTMAVGFIQAYYMNYHSIFLSNFIANIIFISSTIFGLRFRYILLMNSIAYCGYLVFILNGSYPPNDLAFTQIPQLTSFYVIGIISAYVLELHKMKLFKKECILENRLHEIQDLSLVKDRLFRTISHDIRGPISNLKGITNLYKSNKLNDKDMKELVGSLDNEVIKTSILIDNLLAWSKAQIEGLETNKENFLIQGLIHSVVELYEQSIHSKSISIEINISENDKIYADKEMIHIVLRNILSNAIKFNPKNGKVTISGESCDLKGCYKLTIADNGPGIAEEKIKDLFSLSQIKYLGNAHHTGAGLGLNLVKELIDLNNAEIYCESEINKGCKFIIKLPQPEEAND